MFLKGIQDISKKHPTHEMRNSSSIPWEEKKQHESIKHRESPIAIVQIS
jgi:hypothetical protein